MYTTAGCRYTFFDASGFSLRGQTHQISISAECSAADYMLYNNIDTHFCALLLLPKSLNKEGQIHTKKSYQNKNI